MVTEIFSPGIKSSVGLMLAKNEPTEKEPAYRLPDDPTIFMLEAVSVPVDIACENCIYTLEPVPAVRLLAAGDNVPTVGWAMAVPARMEINAKNRIECFIELGG